MRPSRRGRSRRPPRAPSGEHGDADAAQPGHAQQRPEQQHRDRDPARRRVRARRARAAPPGSRPRGARRAPRRRRSPTPHVAASRAPRPSPHGRRVGDPDGDQHRRQRAGEQRREDGERVRVRDRRRSRSSAASAASSASGRMIRNGAAYSRRLGALVLLVDRVPRTAEPDELRARDQEHRGGDEQEGGEGERHRERERWPRTRPAMPARLSAARGGVAERLRRAHCDAGAGRREHVNDRVADARSTCAARRRGRRPGTVPRPAATRCASWLDVGPEVVPDTNTRCPWACATAAWIACLDRARSGREAERVARARPAPRRGSPADGGCRLTSSAVSGPGLSAPVSSRTTSPGRTCSAM